MVEAAQSADKQDDDVKLDSDESEPEEAEKSEQEDELVEVNEDMPGWDDDPAGEAAPTGKQSDRDLMDFDSVTDPEDALSDSNPGGAQFSKMLDLSLPYGRVLNEAPGAYPVSGPDGEQLDVWDPTVPPTDDLDGLPEAEGELVLDAPVTLAPPPNGPNSNPLAGGDTTWGIPINEADQRPFAEELLNSEAITYEDFQNLSLLADVGVVSDTELDAALLNTAFDSQDVETLSASLEEVEGGNDLLDAALEDGYVTVEEWVYAIGGYDGAPTQQELFQAFSAMNNGSEQTQGIVAELGYNGTDESALDLWAQLAPELDNLVNVGSFDGALIELSSGEVGFELPEGVSAYQDVAESSRPTYLSVSDANSEQWFRISNNGDDSVIEALEGGEWKAVGEEESAFTSDMTLEKVYEALEMDASEEAAGWAVTAGEATLTFAESALEDVLAALLFV